MSLVCIIILNYPKCDENQFMYQVTTKLSGKGAREELLWIIFLISIVFWILSHGAILCYRSCCPSALYWQIQTQTIHLYQKLLICTRLTGPNTRPLLVAGRKNMLWDDGKIVLGCVWDTSNSTTSFCSLLSAMSSLCFGWKNKMLVRKSVYVDSPIMSRLSRPRSFNMWISICWILVRGEPEM